MLPRNENVALCIQVKFSPNSALLILYLWLISETIKPY